MSPEVDSKEKQPYDIEATRLGFFAPEALLLSVELPGFRFRRPHDAQEIAAIDFPDILGRVTSLQERPS